MPLDRRPCRSVRTRPLFKTRGGKVDQEGSFKERECFKERAPAPGVSSRVVSLLPRGLILKAPDGATLT